MQFLVAVDICTEDYLPIWNIVGLVVNVIKIGIPIVLIVFGMIDLGKAVISQKEDDIKKQQNVFIKRLIAAALVFFVFAIVQLLVNLVDDNSSELMSCVNNLIKNK